MQILQMKTQNAGSTIVEAQVQQPVAFHGFAGWLFASVATLCKRGWTDRERKRRPQLRVVETLQLGSRRQLLLVSCRGERFLVGTGAETVQTIVRVRPEPNSEMTAAESVESTW